MDAVLQACANRHMVSMEVYTEKPTMTEPKPYNYKTRRRIGKVFQVYSLQKYVFNQGNT